MTWTTSTQINATARTSTAVASGAQNRQVASQQRALAVARKVAKRNQELLRRLA
jgi:hypothetical protein